MLLSGFFSVRYPAVRTTTLRRVLLLANPSAITAWSERRNA
jgi:hypothetical protein